MNCLVSKHLLANVFSETAEFPVPLPAMPPSYSRNKPPRIPYASTLPMSPPVFPFDLPMDGIKHLPLPPLLLRHHLNAIIKREHIPHQ